MFRSTSLDPALMASPDVIGPRICEARQGGESVLDRTHLRTGAQALCGRAIETRAYIDAMQGGRHPSPCHTSLQTIRETLLPRASQSGPT